MGSQQQQPEELNDSKLDRFCESGLYISQFHLMDLVLKHVEIARSLEVLERSHFIGSIVLIDVHIKVYHKNECQNYRRQMKGQMGTTPMIMFDGRY